MISLNCGMTKKNPNCNFAYSKLNTHCNKGFNVKS